jgi:hypothetical protein
MVTKPTGNPRGRPTGAKSKRTKATLAKIDEAAEKLAKAIPGAFTGNAHAFLMAVYKDPANELNIRLDAAKAAVAFEIPRLQATTLKGDADSPLQIVNSMFGFLNGTGRGLAAETEGEAIGDDGDSGVAPKQPLQS